MWLNLDAMARDAENGLTEPQLTPEQTRIVDRLISEQPGPIREQARKFGEMLKAFREA